MTRIPDREQQILQVHATFIRQVVATGQNPDQRGEFELLLKSAESNGWTELVAAIRRIFAGQRDESVLKGLDDEDRAIAHSILRGLQDPATLPDPDAQPDPALAAPGLAHLIQAAASGNAQALQIVSEMATQMSRAGGPMARLAAVIRPLINGERDPERLCKGMDSRTEQVVLGILDALKGEK